MQLNRRYGIYYLVVSFFLCCMLAAIVFILNTDYDRLVHTVVLSMQKNGLEEKIRHTVFPRQRFMLLQEIAWLALIVIMVLFAMAIRYREIALKSCRFVFRSFIQAVHAFLNVYRNNSRQQNLCLFILFVIVILFHRHYLVSRYLTYDEMWSYNYYTANPFYYSFFTYSNYPFFELSTHLFKGLPLPMHVNLRLSPLLFGSASFFLLYACTRKYFGNHFIAMVASASFAFMPLSVHYFANARGVMHELFFAIAGLFSLQFWVNNTSQKQWLVIYLVAGVLGLYSMTPHILFLFLLTFAGIIHLLKKDRPAAWFFAKTNAAALLFFLILYLPVLLTTGGHVYREVITGSASFYDTLSRGPGILGYVAVDFVGSNFIILSLYAIAIPAMMIWRKKLPAKFSLLALITFCLPLSLVFFYLATRFVYAGRSMAFGALSVPLFVCLFLQLIAGWLNKHRALATVMGAGILSLVIVLEVYFYYPVWPLDTYTKDVSDLLIEYNMSNCYDNSKETSGFFNYYPAIEYHYRLQNKPFDLSVSIPNSIRYKALSPGDQYDCIVNDMDVNDSVRASSYHEIYRDPLGKFKISARNVLKK